MFSASSGLFFMVFFVVAVVLFFIALYTLKHREKTKLAILIDCEMNIIESFNDRPLDLTLRYDHYKKLHMAYNYSTDKIRINIENEDWLTTPVGESLHSIHLMIREKMVEYLLISVIEDFNHYKIEYKQIEGTGLRIFREYPSYSCCDTSVSSIVSGIRHFALALKKLALVLDKYHNGRFESVRKDVLELSESLHDNYVGDGNYCLLLKENDFLEFNLGLIYIMFKHFRMDMLKYHLLMHQYYVEVC